MLRLLSVAIVVGLVFENSLKAVGEDEEMGPPLTLPFPVDPVDPTKSAPSGPIIPIWPCKYPTNIKCWTDWFDRDNPSGTGDWETLSSLRRDNPGKICPRPAAIEAQTLSGLSVTAAGDKIFRNNPFSGFVCRNRDQLGKRMCKDYRVRFVCHPPFCGGGVCWTKWYDRDNPSGSGDWEHLSRLRIENKGEICKYPLYIEAVTTDKMTPAMNTGQKFYAFNPTEGLICRNKDQRNGNCRDYKVRFGCPCKY